jgi:Glycosyltransferase family 87
MQNTNELSMTFSRAGVWFWTAIVLGAAIRFYLIVFTEGTFDAVLWEGHSRDVINRGVVGCYHVNGSANHPPFISEMEALLLRMSDATDISYRIFLRAPFALFDAGGAFLLLMLLAASPWRFVIAACYWLTPLAIILSAYHGNVDSAVGFFLLLSVWLLSKEKTVIAAAALGMSLWIKLPGVLAIPALALFVQGWRQRLWFLGVVGIVGVIGYFPALIQDAHVIYRNVLSYRGQNLHTTAGVSTWGPRVLLFSVIASPSKWPIATRAPILFSLAHGWQIGLAFALLISWLRRFRRSAVELGATIAINYVIICALSDGFSFQYFAWSLPLWFLLPAGFCAPAVFLTSAYVYSLYWFLCGNGWLLGQWDFVGHPYWPPFILWFRNAAYLVFFISAVWFLLSEIWQACKPKVRSALWRK